MCVLCSRSSSHVFFPSLLFLEGSLTDLEDCKREGSPTEKVPLPLFFGLGGGVGGDEGDADVVVAIADDVEGRREDDVGEEPPEPEDTAPDVVLLRPRR